MAMIGKAKLLGAVVKMLRGEEMLVGTLIETDVGSDGMINAMMISSAVPGEVLLVRATLGYSEGMLEPEDDPANPAKFRTIFEDLIDGTEAIIELQKRVAMEEFAKSIVDRLMTSEPEEEEEKARSPDYVFRMN